MRTLIKAMVILLVVPFQVTVGDVFSLYGIKPDFAYLAAALFGIFRGPGEGLWVGLTVGFCTDVFSGGVHHLHLLMKSLAGYLAGMVGKVSFRMEGLLLFLGIFLLSFFQNLVIVLLGRVFTGTGAVWDLTGKLFLQAFYDGCVGIVFCELLMRAWKLEQGVRRSAVLR